MHLIRTRKCLVETSC